MPRIASCLTRASLRVGVTEENDPISKRRVAVTSVASPREPASNHRVGVLGVVLFSRGEEPADRNILET